MSEHARRRPWGLAAILLLAGVLPPALYAAWLGPAPSMEPEEARLRIERAPETTVLADIRSPAEFAAERLPGAVNWPACAILAAKDVGAVPTSLRGRTLLLICPSGIQSVFAARHLRGIGVPEVFSVRDGIEAWIASLTIDPCTGRLRDAASIAPDRSFRETAPFEQTLAVFGGFTLKPLYMFLSLGLIIVLWRQAGPDLAALRASFVFFLAGELACEANFLLAHDRSALFEYLHSYGMVVAFALAAFALAEGLDRRILHVSDPDAPCALLPLCGPCRKHANVPCGMRRILILLVALTAGLSLIPLSMEIRPGSINTGIWGYAYNLSHPAVHQIYEIRFLPLAAMGFSLAAFLPLLVRPAAGIEGPMRAAAAAAGALGFSLFRGFLCQAFAERQIWFGFWEEFSETLYVLGVIAVLWTFRGRLFHAAQASAGPSREAGGG